MQGEIAMIEDSREIVTDKHVFLFSLVLAASLTGCTSEEGHWDWTCGNGRKDLDLICEISRDIPDSHRAGDLHVVDLCRRLDSTDQNLNLEFYLTTVADSGQYVAVGGYCDFRPRLTGFLEYLEDENSAFDGMLMQFYSCDPPQYRDLVTRLEEVGFRVTVHSLKNCGEDQSSN